MGSKTRVELGAMPIGNLDPFGDLIGRGPSIFDNSKPFANAELPKSSRGSTARSFGILTRAFDLASQKAFSPHFRPAVVRPEWLGLSAHRAQPQRRHQREFVTH